MPNRILKESICTSENLDKLSSFQETFFYRLIVNCDDYGRFDARPKILAARLFPLKDVRTNQIEDALRALTSAELVTLYEVDGKPFIQMTTWTRHQQIRNSKSRYPSPDDINCNQLKSIDINCNQLQSNDINCTRNPIQSNTNPNPNPNPTVQADERFERFWSAYPRKQDKKTARSKFDKLNPSEEELDKMLKAIEYQKSSDQWKRDNGQFVPMPSTWLNQERWNDQMPGKILAPSEQLHDLDDVF